MGRPDPPPVPGTDLLTGRGTRTTLVDVTLAVVTPLFGGGATPRRAELLDPVRGASIRGHLRFWWRACNAHRYANAAALFAAEAGIWGATSATEAAGGPSLVEVEVCRDGWGTLDDHCPWKEITRGHNRLSAHAH